MFSNLKKSFGLDPNEKQLKAIRPIVKQVIEEQEKIKQEHENDTLEDFIKFAQQKTSEYKREIQEKIEEVKEKNKDILGEGHIDQIRNFNKKVQIGRQKILDEILPEAYALVRETARRVLKSPEGKPMEHFEEQIIGGVALHWGRVTEMATGEGKTLVATMPAYLNALAGEGVHVVTVNEYLAQRDPRWMGPLYDSLGVSVGVNLSSEGYRLYSSELSIDQEIDDLIKRRNEIFEKVAKSSKKPKESVIKEFEEIEKKMLEKIHSGSLLKKEAYSADITYGTNSEFGFDYLRDNMVLNPEDKVQRGRHFAIIDEVDSILIDEARTPLIISGPSNSPVEQYSNLNPKVKEIMEEQSKIIEKKRKKVEQTLKTYKTYLEEDKSKEKKTKIEELKTELGHLLLQIKKGDPRNSLLTERLDVEPLMQTALKVREREENFLNQNKLEDPDLLFIASERENYAVLTNKGWNKVYSKNFKMPSFEDFQEKLEKIEGSDLSSEGKAEEKQKAEIEYSIQLDNINAINNLLHAYVFLKKEKDYVVEDGQVIIVDSFTGRKMPSRRYSDGLHEAVEAKEGIKVQAATQTVARVSFQNYFKMYSKIAGMTGTAETEKDEFLKIYGMDTLVIPTHKPLDREEHNDVIYLTEKMKFKKVVEEIKEHHEKGRPVLVGTASVGKSNYLSHLLSEEEIPHRVLNASRMVDKTEGWEGKLATEAEIIKHAGERGAVTISTNMAGRGTDIILGYNPELLIKNMSKAAENLSGKEKEYVTKLLQNPDFIEKFELKDFDISNISDYKEALERIAYHVANKEKEGVVKLGGLHVIGTERHESRRIDNQLRGRAGRQGDPGSSKFYLSLEDDLLRIFGSEKIQNVCAKLNFEEDTIITHSVITNAINRAQKRIEEQHFGIRNNLVKIDDTDNQLRNLVYSDRDMMLKKDEPKEYIIPMVKDVVEMVVNEYVDENKFPEEWDWEGLEKRINGLFGIKNLPIDKEKIGLTTELEEQINDIIIQKYETRELEAIKTKFYSFIKNEKITDKKVKDEIENLLKQGDETIISRIDPKILEETKLKLRIYDKHVALANLTEKWKILLNQTEALKEGIGLTGYGQKDPIIEYKKKSYEMFDDFITDVKEGIVRSVFLRHPAQIYDGVIISGF